MSRRASDSVSIEELRTQISQRLRSNAAFSKPVYQDQPIIMTGSQLKSFVPDAIREACQIARQGHGQGMGVVDVFYNQARHLAGYEDDFDFSGTFSHYFPTYEDMSNEQLRGYFTWRTKVRNGLIEQGSVSFAYVYLYELINLIGVSSAAEGYQAMHSFGTQYRQFDTRFGRLFDAWLDDFVIYYGLDASLLKISSFVAQDEAFDVLLNREAYAQDAIFDALVTLGDYPIGDSPFFTEHADELKRLVAQAYSHAASHHDTKLKTSLADKLSGRIQQRRIELFERAVFADPLSIENSTYTVSPHDTVYCRCGVWFKTRYAKLEQPLEWVTQLLETCECALRDAYEYPNTLDRTIGAKYLVKNIDTLARELHDETIEREKRAVRIDFDKLDHIRQAASATCEKLIVDEDEATCGDKDENASVNQLMSGDGVAAQTVLSSHESASAASGSYETRFEQPSPDATHIEAIDPGTQCPLSPKPSLLTSDETGLISCLLSGDSVREFEREHACMASVLVDSINEKLYDEFSDICIDMASGEPALIEDYAHDLRAMFVTD